MIIEASRKSAKEILFTKLAAYAAFTKLRLTFLVVVSSVIGYAIGAQSFSWLMAFWLSVAGFLVTGASNGFNQVIEKDLDALMKRTESRPIPIGTMSVLEGLILASVMGVLGLVLLYLAFNPLAAVLGGLALFSYVLIYTPLKRITPLAVFVGAFPGAIPPMLGYVAATGAFDLYAGLLFAVQFVWQFPHFWAIAWVSHQDYAKAGYHLLPSKGGRDSQSAFLTMLYALFLIPVGLLPWAFGLNGNIAAVGTAILAVGFAFPAIQLYLKKTDNAARTVMFASFLYLPLVQLIFLFDKM
jgi:protoheme IX farnesyltransferase